MNGRESRWVDPAPLEVSRPRLPWWTMLPGWVKLILSPIALVILLSWLAYQAGRVVFRYPLTIVVIVAVGWLWSLLGEWALTAIGGVLIVGFAVWWWRARPSFERFVMPRPRTEFRRFVIYACQWRTVMRLSELAKDKRGKEHRPRLRRVRAEGWRDLVRVRMIKGQAPEQWELHASGLAHSFHANSCRVRVVKPGVV